MANIDPRLCGRSPSAQLGLLFDDTSVGMAWDNGLLDIEKYRWHPEIRQMGHNHASILPSEEFDDIHARFDTTEISRNLYPYSDTVKCDLLKRELLEKFRPIIREIFKSMVSETFSL